MCTSCTSFTDLYYLRIGLSLTRCPCTRRFSWKGSRTTALDLNLGALRTSITSQFRASSYFSPRTSICSCTTFTITNPRAYPMPYGWRPTCSVRGTWAGTLAVRTFASHNNSPHEDQRTHLRCRARLKCEAILRRRARKKLVLHTVTPQSKNSLNRVTR